MHNFGASTDIGTMMIKISDVVFLIIRPIPYNELDLLLRINCVLTNV